MPWKRVSMRRAEEVGFTGSGERGYWLIVTGGVGPREKSWWRLSIKKGLSTRQFHEAYFTNTHKYYLFLYILPIPLHCSVTMSSVGLLSTPTSSPLDAHLPPDLLVSSQ